MTTNEHNPGTSSLGVSRGDDAASAQSPLDQPQRAYLRNFLQLLVGLNSTEINQDGHPDPEHIQRIIDQAYQDNPKQPFISLGEISMSAASNLESGRLYPYDQPDDVDTPVPATDWAHAAARGALSNLKGRGGVSNELEQYDEEIREEIIREIAEIIRLAHAFHV